MPGLLESLDGGPRSALRLVGVAFGTYRRFPLLFLALAAGVIVPYQAVVFIATGADASARSGVGVEALLALADFALVLPLLSALHVLAVRELHEGRRPGIPAVGREGLKVLFAAGIASLLSWLGIFVGLLALVVPGVILLLRWCVVTQAAAIEQQGWRLALRRSGHLTDRRYRHVFPVVCIAGLIVVGPPLLVRLGFGLQSTELTPFLAGSAVGIVTSSFGALVGALLYYDLRVRQELAFAASGDASAAAEDPSPTSPPVAPTWDPRDYAPEDRPAGWYVDPGNPARMRYWQPGESPSWHPTTTRTPGEIRRAWRA